MAHGKRMPENSANVDTLRWVLKGRLSRRQWTGTILPTYGVRIGIELKIIGRRTGRGGQEPGEKSEGVDMFILKKCTNLSVETRGFGIDQVDNIADFETTTLEASCSVRRCPSLSYFRIQDVEKFECGRL